MGSKSSTLLHICSYIVNFTLLIFAGFFNLGVLLLNALSWN